VLDIGRPEDHWNCESEAQPKLVTKHGDGMSGVTVVTRVGLRNLVTDMWVGHFSMGLVCHVVHFELRNEQTERCVQVFVLGDHNSTLRKP